MSPCAPILLACLGQRLNQGLILHAGESARHAPTPGLRRMLQLVSAPTPGSAGNHSSFINGGGKGTQAGSTQGEASWGESMWLWGDRGQDPPFVLLEAHN